MTEHLTGKGLIAILLPQPHASFMRMYLAKLKEKDKLPEFSYFIETSLDERNWTRVVGQHGSPLLRVPENRNRYTAGDLHQNFRHLFLGI